MVFEIDSPGTATPRTSCSRSPPRPSRPCSPPRRRTATPTADSSYSKYKKTRQLKFKKTNQSIKHNQNQIQTIATSTRHVRRSAGRRLLRGSGAVFFIRPVATVIFKVAAPPCRDAASVFTRELLRRTRRVLCNSIGQELRNIRKNFFKKFRTLQKIFKATLTG